MAVGPRLSAAQIADTRDHDLPILVWAQLTGLDEPGSERQTVWFVEHANFEVGNGGFVQYFFNTDGEYADLTIAALADIGAEHHESVFREAVDRWRLERSQHGQLPGTLEGYERFRAVSTLPEFDERWHDVSLESIEAQYIRANLEAFVTMD